MSRKKNRQAREVRRKAAVTARGHVEGPIEKAQGAINHLQHLLDDHGCPPVLNAIVCAKNIAVASHIVGHSHYHPNGEVATLSNPTPKLTAEREAADKLIEKLRTYTEGDPDPAIGFRAFAAITIEFANSLIRIEEAARYLATGDPSAFANATRNHGREPNGRSQSVSQPLTDLQALTKAWVAKSNDPNATPEEREQAKKLVEEYGIGDTRLLQ